MNKQEIGSMTAKGGFKNEDDICKKFTNYKNDKEAKLWLQIMGYDHKKIQNLSATQIPVRINLQKAIALGVLKEKYEETIKFKKADMQLKVEVVIDDIIYVENISLKKANAPIGKNQIDKRPVATYQKIWGFDDEIAKWLKIFTGEILPKDILNSKELEQVKDKKQRRLFLDEIPEDRLKEIITFFSKNKLLVINDILRGRGGLSAEWFLVTRKNKDNSLNWVLKDINTVCNFYAQGKVKPTPRNSLRPLHKSTKPHPSGKITLI